MKFVKKNRAVTLAASVSIVSTLGLLALHIFPVLASMPIPLRIVSDRGMKTEITPVTR